MAIGSKNSLGRLVRARRVQLGMSQRELGRQAGVTDSAISLIETGVTQSVTPNVLHKLAEALQVPIDDLLSPNMQLQAVLADTEKGLAEALRGPRVEALLQAQEDASTALMSGIVRGTLTVDDLKMVRTMIESLVAKNERG